MTRQRKSDLNWRSRATVVGDCLPLARLHPAALAWIERRRKMGPWCVAFSGGADSLALLLLAWMHWPERRHRLVALHFNHRLRGRESAADERFCRQICAALGVRLAVGRWKHAGRGAGRTAGRARLFVSEAEARAARQKFFSREMRRRHCRVLWLAHQQDDIAESMLMRLARGSGAGGLAAPRPVQPTGDGRTHLRPLLTCKKAELVAALRKAGATWREDSSNVRGDYFRNRIRSRVLPAWIKAAERDALAGAAWTRELLDEDETALAIWTEQIARCGRDRRLNVAALAGIPRAVVRRAVHRWLRLVRPDTDLSRQGFGQLLAAVELGRPTRFSLGRKGFAVIRQGKMAFKKS